LNKLISNSNQNKLPIIITIGILILSFLFFSEWLQKSKIIIFPSGAKQVICLIYFFTFFFIGNNKFNLHKKYFTYLIILLIFIIVNYFIVDVKPLNYFLGIIFTFNFAIIFLFSSNTNLSISTIIKYLKILLYLILIFSVPTIIQGLIDGDSLRMHPGLFREAGALGTTMNCGVVISVSLFIFTKKKIYLYFALFLTFGVFFTTLKKAIICSCIIWCTYAYFFLSFRKMFNFLIYSIFFLFLSIIFVGAEILQDIYENIDYLERAGDNHVRLSMYLASFKIANDYFPFGCGLGSFGSIPSLIGNYSNIYYEYGIADIQPLGPEIVASGATHMLFDTYWPHILGEMGFIGLILFSLIWLFPVSRSLKALKSINANIFIKSAAFFIFSITILITIEGFTLYTPEIPAFVFLESGIAGYLFYHLKNSKVL
jgi:hypothetical protein